MSSQVRGPDRAPAKEVKKGKRRSPLLGLVEGGVLSLRLPAAWPESMAPIAWHWSGGARGPQQGVVQTLSDLPPSTRGARTRVWTPPGDTVLTRANIPTRSRAKIMQALPYALEDQLLGEPESLHFAFRPQHDGGLAVAVTARERLKTWTAALQSAQLNLESLCPATLMLPLPPDGWTLAFDGDEIIARTADVGGFLCAAPADLSIPAELELTLAEAKERNAHPSSLLILGAPDGFDPHAWSESLGLPVVAEGGDIWGEEPAIAPINLLQREFAPDEKSRQALRKLWPAAVMLVIWMVVGLGFNLWEWWKLNRVYKAQQTEMTTLFRQSFPDAKTVVDPALQMERNLASLKAKSGELQAGDFLPLLGRVAPSLQASSQAKLKSLQYSDATLQIDLTVNDFQSMDAIKNGLTSQGINAEVVNANNRGEVVEGRLRVKGEKRK